MQKLIYLDTNIYLDYLENRTDRLRPLGEFAFRLIKRTIDCEFNVAVSSLVLAEIKFNNYTKQFTDLINSLKDMNKIVYIEMNENDNLKARKFHKERKTSFNDTLHVVLANKVNAILITRNLKDFEELQDLIEISLPENL